jgi:hypothetical protein
MESVVESCGHVNAGRVQQPLNLEAVDEGDEL